MDAAASAAGDGRVNVQAELRSVKARLAALEARQRPHKRVAAPRPADAVIAAREKLWARYVLLDVQHRGRITKLAFAIRHRLNPSEFCRWFSATDRRGIPQGSGPDQRFHEALREAIAELDVPPRGGNPPVAAIAAADSHGKMTSSQFFGPRPQ